MIRNKDGTIDQLSTPFRVGKHTEKGREVWSVSYFPVGGESKSFELAPHQMESFVTLIKEAWDND